MIKSLFRKSFLKISYVGIGNFVNAGLGFLFLTAVAKSLTVGDFGRYALLSALLVSLSKILDFGTNSVFVAKAISTDDKNLMSQFISIKFILFLIALPISLIALYLLGLFSIGTVLVFVLGLVFYGFNFTLFGLFQKMENYTILILLNTIPASIKGIFAGLILFNLVNMSFLNYFMVFSFCIGPSALLYIFLPKDMKTFKLDLSKAKETLKEAFSPGISQLINESFPAVNNTLAKIYTSFNTVGIFSLADKISNIFTLVSFTIFTVLLPRNAQRKKQKAGYDFTETIILGFGVMLLAFFTIAASAIFIPWFFNDKYNESIEILNILVFASAIGAIHVFLENYFFVEGKTGYLAGISLVKLILLVVFSAMLMPVFSINGLAWAQLFSSALGLAIIITLISSQKQKPA